MQMKFSVRLSCAENDPTSSIFSPVHLLKPETQKSHLSVEQDEIRGRSSGIDRPFCPERRNSSFPVSNLDKNRKSEKRTPSIRRLETGGLGFVKTGAIQERRSREASKRMA